MKYGNRPPLRFGLVKTAASIVVGIVSLAASSHAGIPECNNVRLEDVRSCEIQGDVECSAGCERLGIYKKACATKLHTVCRSECTLAAEPTCTDECTTQCEGECDRGVSITCSHNCFGECVGSCQGQCDGVADPEQCQASCEATCDGECDAKCAAVVDESCYVHCIECCGGSCGAQANMDCQETCQDEQFESCEYDLEADCSASCTGSGALFCDGEYVLSAEDVEPCVRALVARGISAADLRASASFDLDELAADSDGTATTGCALTRHPDLDPRSLWAMGSLGLGILLWRRRR